MSRQFSRAVFPTENPEDDSFVRSLMHDLSLTTNAPSSSHHLSLPTSSTSSAAVTAPSSLTPTPSSSTRAFSLANVRTQPPSNSVAALLSQHLTAAELQRPHKITEPATARLGNSRNNLDRTDPNDPFTQPSAGVGAGESSGNSLFPHSDPTRILKHMVRLCSHLYTRGLIDGAGSDITVCVPAFSSAMGTGKTYNLHRIILYQNSYFSSLLEGPWRESQNDMIELHFDNPYITPKAFEFALGRLYGHLDEPILESNVLNVFATCSYLDIPDVCEMCVEFILRNLSESNVLEYLTFADSQMILGREKIMEAISTYLCREGFSNQRLREGVFSRCDASWVKRVVESDAFWVPSEYERYVFAKEIVMRRRKITMEEREKEREAAERDGIVIVIGNTVNGGEPSSPPMSSSRRESMFLPQVDLAGYFSSKHSEDGESSRVDSRTPDAYAPSVASTTNPVDYDENIYSQIFSQSIYYIHMSFEELNLIRKDQDLTMVPEHVLMDALWQQIELRTKIENAAEDDMVLGTTTDVTSDIAQSHTPRSTLTKHIFSNGYPVLPRMLYAIPTEDTTHHIGESGVLIVSSKESPLDDRFGSSNDVADDHTDSPKKSYSTYAPFRFSVEFRDVHRLKEKLRVYSQPVFYAGSNWNLYIHKIKTPKKGIQLGVYLHRQSMPRGVSDLLDDSSANLNTNPSSTPQTYSPTPTHTPTNSTSQARAQTPSPSTSTSFPSFSRYADKRKIVRTWFKIFCPSGGPSHNMTLFPSGPDEFSLQQSWGWRSSSLFSGEYLADTVDLNSDGEVGKGVSTTLRFSVVMGHI